jgi:hypothetical protein
MNSEPTDDDVENMVMVAGHELDKCTLPLMAAMKKAFRLGYTRARMHAAPASACTTCQLCHGRGTIENPDGRGRMDCPNGCYYRQRASEAVRDENWRTYQDLRRAAGDPNVPQRPNEARARALAWSKEGTENEPEDGILAACPETPVVDVALFTCRLHDCLDVWAPNLASVARNAIVDSVCRYLRAVAPTGGEAK